MSQGEIQPAASAVPARRLWMVRETFEARATMRKQSRMNGAPVVANAAPALN